MKLSKLEKIWLGVVVAFYVCYNLPFVPAYHCAQATLIHALITLIPLWIAIYVGLTAVCRQKKLKNVKEAPAANPMEPELLEDQGNSDLAKEDK